MKQFTESEPSDPQSKCLCLCHCCTPVPGTACLFNHVFYYRLPLSFSNPLLLFSFLPGAHLLALSIRIFGALRPPPLVYFLIIPHISLCFLLYTFPLYHHGDVFHLFASASPPTPLSALVLPASLLLLTHSQWCNGTICIYSTISQSSDLSMNTPHMMCSVFQFWGWKCTLKWDIESLRLSGQKLKLCPCMDSKGTCDYFCQR